MHQLIAIQLNNSVKFLQFENSLLAIDEDITHQIHPGQKQPVLAFCRHVNQSIYLCHPAALKAVIKTIFKNNCRTQYLDIPKGINASMLLVIPEEEFIPITK